MKKNVIVLGLIASFSLIQLAHAGSNELAPTWFQPTSFYPATGYATDKAVISTLNTVCDNVWRGDKNAANAFEGSLGRTICSDKGDGKPLVLTIISDAKVKRPGGASTKYVSDLLVVSGLGTGKKDYERKCSFTVQNKLQSIAITDNLTTSGAEWAFKFEGKENNAISIVKNSIEFNVTVDCPSLKVYRKALFNADGMWRDTF
ncbi:MULTISPECIES: hypothetical protein [Aeromonas]|uniref:hypothetical protein n=1 Tax=Aeromonas TaxID=642 RepID=UPI0015DCDC8F|nr:hypothetical protein [Aeromonas sp. WP2-W18-CRE-05]BBQ24724.1 hypothetical protein WP2W18C05_09400 [Aeromonas sp. WP2-W18-CRE-05]